MAIRVLPVRSGVPAFSFRSELDSTIFEFRFTFNLRQSVWTMDIFDEASNPLLRGIPINVRQLLIDRFQYNLQLPQGNLFALNLVEQNTNPTFENFGDDVVLLYEEV